MANYNSTANMHKSLAASSLFPSIRKSTSLLNLRAQVISFI